MLHTLVYTCATWWQLTTYLPSMIIPQPPLSKNLRIPRNEREWVGKQEVSSWRAGFATWYPSPLLSLTLRFRVRNHKNQLRPRKAVCVEFIDDGKWITPFPLTSLRTTIPIEFQSRFTRAYPFSGMWEFNFSLVHIQELWPKFQDMCITQPRADLENCL